MKIGISALKFNLEDALNICKKNKKIKENNLLQAAFNLFTKHDITNVSVNDIVKNAGVAKGTFYLYFKDKYQIRDILIQKEAHRLFEEAHKQLEKNDIRNFEDSVIFLINQVLRISTLKWDLQILVLFFCT